MNAKEGKAFKDRTFMGAPKETWAEVTEKFELLSVLKHEFHSEQTFSGSSSMMKSASAASVSHFYH
jgi:hypothetical protein